MIHLCATNLVISARVASTSLLSVSTWLLTPASPVLSSCSPSLLTPTSALHQSGVSTGSRDQVSTNHGSPDPPLHGLHLGLGLGEAGPQPLDLAALVLHLQVQLGLARPLVLQEGAVRGGRSADKTGYVLLYYFLLIIVLSADLELVLALLELPGSALELLSCALVSPLAGSP